MVLKEQAKAALMAYLVDHIVYQWFKRVGALFGYAGLGDGAFRPGGGLHVQEQEGQGGKGYSW